MLTKLYVVVALLCMAPYAAAATNSIGTVSAEGPVRVDHYAVEGNATLFRGSEVQTGQASANLLLGKGVKMTMATDSQSTLYRHRAVLQHGASELTASNPFEMEADGLHITPDAPNSRGTVSLMNANTVQVAARSGGFKVTDSQGVLVASVHPGSPLNFAVQAGGTSMGNMGAGSSTQPTKPLAFSDVGMVNQINGHYYLTDAAGNRFELMGNNLDKFVGDKVVIAGSEVPLAHSANGVAGVVNVSRIGINGPNGPVGLTSARTKVLVYSAILAGGVGAAVGTYEADRAPAPVSR